MNDEIKNKIISDYIDDFCLKFKKKFVNELKEEVEYNLNLFINSICEIKKNNIALDIYFKTLNLKIENNNMEWFKIYFNIAPIVLKRINNIKSETEKKICYGGLEKIFNYSDYYTILSSMFFTVEELKELGILSSSIAADKILNKINNSALSEIYFEYVEPISDTDYEEEIDLETIYEMHKENANYNVVFDQVINQLVNKEDFNKKIKVYVVPKL